MNGGTGRLTKILNSPARMAIAVGLFILAGEFLIMLLIEAASDFFLKNRISTAFWEFVDPVVLIAIVSPALYLLVFRPIRAQQDLFRRVFETINVGIVLTRGGKLLYANPECGRLTGYSREQLLTMDYWELVHPDQRATMRERVAARQRGEALTDRYEYRLNTKDGTEAWAETSAALIDYQGKKTVFASFIDVTRRKRVEAAHTLAQQTLAQIIQGSPVPTFVIDAAHVVTHWNQACEQITGIAAATMVGTRDQWRAFYPEQQRPVLADLVVNGAGEAAIAETYHNKLRASPLIQGAFEAEGFFAGLGENGRVLYFTAAPLHDGQGRVTGAIETLQVITERKLAEEALRNAHSDLELQVLKRTTELEQANLLLARDVKIREDAEAVLLRRNAELSELNGRLKEAQEQLLQAEKMASIGQLAAGVAHEINNPIGYVHSNIGSLEGYLGDLFRILDAYVAAEAEMPADQPVCAEPRRLRAELDLAFLRQDIPQLMNESKEGISRVRKIVQDLKDFSHVDSSQEWRWADLHQGLDSTLNVVNNEIKYKAEVVKEYGELPQVECLPSELNQVFLNLLVNAAHAIADGERGRITLRSGSEGERVWIEVADNGCGIAPENLKRIFDPFFTTKPIGRGTGLGLSLSYGIVKKHGGSIEVDSEPGRGTTFRIVLPLRQDHAHDQEGVQ